MVSDKISYFQEPMTLQLSLPAKSSLFRVVFLLKVYILPYFFLFFPQLKQYPLWTQMVPPHSGQDHLIFSFLTNCRIPNSLIFLRFSIMLISYLVLYLLSKCSRLPQGNFSHWKQYFDLPFWNTSQVLILHLVRVTGLWVSEPLQPVHLFFPLR